MGGTDLGLLSELEDKLIDAGEKMKLKKLEMAIANESSCQSCIAETNRHQLAPQLAVNELRRKGVFPSDPNR